MSAPVAASAPHTAAVLATLQTAGILAGHAVAPDGGGWQGEPGRSTYVPYAVVYPSPGVPDGNVSEPHEYLDYSAQINCWAATADQAERLADQVRAALVGRRLTVPGRSTYPVQQPPGSVPVARFDQPPPATYRAVVEITVRSQPQ